MQITMTPSRAIGMTTMLPSLHETARQIFALALQGHAPRCIVDKEQRHRDRGETLTHRIPTHGYLTSVKVASVTVIVTSQLQ